MTKEEVYEKVMGHEPDKRFGVKGSFSWDDISRLMAGAVENHGVSHHVTNSCDFKIGYKNENGNMKEVLINAEGCDEAYDKFKKQFGDIKVEYLD